MLCDIFPAPSSTEIRADWTEERRDDNVRQTPPPVTTSHQSPPATSYTGHFILSYYQYQYQYPHTKIADMAKCQPGLPISLIILSPMLKVDIFNRF